MNPSTKNQIQSAIIQTYSDRLSELPEHKQRHFLYRAWHATKREDLFSLLTSIGIPYTKHNIDSYEHFRKKPDPYIQEKIAEIEKYSPKKVNDEKKKEQWLLHPSIYTYHSLIWTMFYASFFSIPYEIDREALHPAKVMDELLSSPDFVEYAPVCAINSVMLGKKLGIIDRERECIALFQRVFSIEKQEARKSDPLFLTNCIYGLTHIIIGATRFYQEPIQTKDYHWIAETFNRLHNEIYSLLTLDTNIEVALSYRFLHETSEPYQSDILKRIEAQFDPETGYIHREEHNTFSFAEHSNAIALLLLSSTLPQA